MYSIYDRDTQYLCHTGRNSQTEEQAIEDMIDMIIDSDSIDSEEDKKSIKESNIEDKREFLDQIGYEVSEHKEPHLDTSSLL